MFAVRAKNTSFGFSLYSLCTFFPRGIQVVGCPIKLSTSDRLLLSASFASAFGDAKSRAGTNKHRTAGRKQTRLPSSKVQATWGWLGWTSGLDLSHLAVPLPGRDLFYRIKLVVLSGTTTDRQVGCLAVALWRCDQNSYER